MKSVFYIKQIFPKARHIKIHKNYRLYIVYELNNCVVIFKSSIPISYSEYMNAAFHIDILN